MDRQLKQTAFFGTDRVRRPLEALSIDELPVDRPPMVLVKTASLDELLRQFPAKTAIDELNEQLFMDQVVYGFYATRTADDFPFVERIDPGEFFNLDILVPA